MITALASCWRAAVERPDEIPDPDAMDRWERAVRRYEDRQADRDEDGDGEDGEHDEDEADDETE